MTIADMPDWRRSVPNSWRTSAGRYTWIPDDILDAIVARVLPLAKAHWAQEHAVSAGLLAELRWHWRADQRADQIDVTRTRAERHL